MCQFKSAIVLKNGDVIHSDWTDSHEDLIDMLELSDKGGEGFVRVEFVPDENKYSDPKSYQLKIDQNDTPGWWTEIVAERTSDYLREVIKRMIIKSDKKCLVGGSYILDGANIGRCVNANVIVMLGSSNVGTMLGSSNVGTMRESSNVGTMWESSNVGTMWESSKVGTMRESSKVGTMRESSKVGTMWESSKVGTMLGSSKVGMMLDSSNVGTMRESSNVGTMRESSNVGTMWESSKVGTMRESSKVGTDKRIK